MMVGWNPSGTITHEFFYFHNHIFEKNLHTFVKPFQYYNIL